MHIIVLLDSLYTCFVCLLTIRVVYLDPLKDYPPFCDELVKFKEIENVTDARKG